MQQQKDGHFYFMIPLSFMQWPLPTGVSFWGVGGAHSPDPSPINSCKAVNEINELCHYLVIR